MASIERSTAALDQSPVTAKNRKGANSLPLEHVANKALRRALKRVSDQATPECAASHTNHHSYSRKG